MHALRLTMLMALGLGASPDTGSLPLEMVYDGRLHNDWQDLGGNAARRLGGAGRERQAAHLNMAHKASWIVGKPGLAGRFDALVFQYWAPPKYGEFIELRLDAPREVLFPRVIIGAAHTRRLADGLHEVRVPMSELNPGGLEFDRVVFKARKDVGSDWVLFDRIALRGAAARPASAVAITVPDAGETLLAIDCTAKALPIDPMIYGIGFDPRLNARDTHQWDLAPGARRWGGNATSRYNWRLGNAWNTAADWFFRNVNYTNVADYNYTHFFEENEGHGAQSVLTLPMIGWVAKDIDSASFPTSKFGPQKHRDPNGHDAGNGVRPDGKLLTPGPATQTSVEATPEMIGEWVRRIVERDRKRGKRSVQMYILDNEPDLWNTTHRDVHPQPVSYDELLERTIAYGTAIRRADPEAVIAGPASWGWPGYFFSAADAAAGFRLKPDRRAHGDVPLLAWYLRSLAEHEARTGVHILDVVDVHYYPMGQGVGSKNGATDPATAARRLRATRSLWDPSYVDESWINDSVQLLPRLKELIAANYPGRGIAIGEWNFGAETHISGGLAAAEALGRFAEAGVKGAFYWTYPPKGSPAFHAFKAFRNYDGHGASFGTHALTTRARPGVSLFAARDKDKIVAIVLNLDARAPVEARIDLGICGQAAERRTFTYRAGDSGLVEGVKKSGEGIVVRETLAPHSINVLEIRLQPRAVGRAREQ